MNLRLFFVVILLANTQAQALVWDEAISGDLSGDHLHPTLLTLDVGVNTIAGSMGQDLPSSPIDRDIFTFTLGAGQALTSIYVTHFDIGNQSFYAIAPGKTIDIDSAATHLSNTLVKFEGEILDDLATGSFSDGTGLTAPLGPGTYTIWFQERSNVANYTIDYTVLSAVPEPGTACSGLMLGLVAGASRMRLRRSI